MVAKKRIKITVTVDPDFYPILQGLASDTDLSRDEMIEQAIKRAYREEIKKLAARFQQALNDEPESEIAPRTAVA